MKMRTCTLGNVFEGIECAYIKGASDTLEVGDVAYSSRDVQPGALFVCVRGAVADGHGFAEDALQRGACALVVDHELECDAPQVLVEDTRRALALCSANFFDHPSRKLKIVGVTGTNGKTTTAYLVEHIVRCLGGKAGLIGTVECRIDGLRRPSAHTTPESRDLQALLAEMVDAGVDTVAMEVSSHAIDLGRIEATQFSVEAFTNLTQDHLDYHKTMERYFEAKSALFSHHPAQAAVVCTDGEYGCKLVDMLEHKLGRSCLAVGSDLAADLSALDAEYAPHCTRLVFDFRGETIEFTLPLVGRFNVENALVAAGIGISLGYGLQEVCDALACAPQVPGRLERVIGSSGSIPGFGVLVDYAHTPDSIAKAISAVRAVTPGRVICVFGCGGDRDAGKRPKMGKAAQSADFAIVTNDNPRTEDPEAIIAQILPGMPDKQRLAVCPDRREAIAQALGMACDGDAVLIAGKGHEDYQIIGTVKHDFDDRKVAAEEIEALCSR